MTNPQPPPSGSTGGSGTDGGHPQAEIPTPQPLEQPLEEPLLDPMGGHPQPEGGDPV